jgi:hypothetical protein
MDAIIELPPSQGYDSIMVFVDRFTKQAHFVPYTAKGFDAPNLAPMFRQNIDIPLISYQTEDHHVTILASLCHRTRHHAKLLHSFSPAV